MSEPGPTWAVDTIKREANKQRRHPGLWRLVTKIQHEAGRLAHLVEDPPAGFDPVFDQGEVLDRAAEICRLCEEIIAGAVVAGAGEVDHAGND